MATVKGDAAKTSEVLQCNNYDVVDGERMVRAKILKLQVDVHWLERPDYRIAGRDGACRAGDGARVRERPHTAVKIAPHYHVSTVHVLCLARGGCCQFAAECIVR